MQLQCIDKKSSTNVVRYYHQCSFPHAIVSSVHQINTSAFLYTFNLDDMILNF
jgi:hypothetical protein